MPKVAVYGTLKSGYHNHHYLGIHAKLHDVALTQDTYLMVDAGGYPAIIPSLRGKKVWVEVYEVGEGIIKQLDQLEGVPHLFVKTETYTDDLDEVILYVGNLDRFKDHPPYERNKDPHFWDWEG